MSHTRRHRIHQQNVLNAMRRGIRNLAANPPAPPGGPPAPPGDPDFANVVLLLDFAGVNGGTDTTDLSNSAHVETFQGTAEVDTDIKIIGENTLLLRATGTNYVQFPDSPDFDLGTGDFTVECFVRHINFAAGHQVPISTGTSTGWYLRIATTGSTLQFINNGGGYSEDFTFAVGTTYHLAMSRTGTDLRGFIDGVQLGATLTNSEAWDSSGVVLRVGVQNIGGSPQAVRGNIGAVRITKGVGRYTENFTPLTEFYPTQ